MPSNIRAYRRSSSANSSKQLIRKQSPRATYLANAFSLGEGGSEFLHRNEIDKHKLGKTLDSRIIQTFKDRDNSEAFELSDILPYLRDGVGVILDDDFSLCFKKDVEQPWNFTWYLMFTWLLGIVFRYCVLCPIRILILSGGFVVFMTGIWITGVIYKDDSMKRNKIELALVKFLAQAFITAFGGVIKYHGVLPRKKANQVFVANHSTMNDVLLLLQLRPFCIVGQAHSAKFVKYLQNVVLRSLKCIWFDRKAKNDRELVKRKLKEHISDPKNPRLLLFPEGTCVNNEYCVQFKRGAFSLGDEVEVCPVAIKYNKLFSDPYWLSREQPFHMHVLELMCSWAVVADVWFLPPQKRKIEETVDEFAARVKKMISSAGGLKNVEWNGYLKHYKPSARVIQAKKRLFKERLLKRFPHLRQLLAENEENELKNFGHREIKPKIDL